MIIDYNALKFHIIVLPSHYTKYSINKIAAQGDAEEYSLEGGAQGAGRGGGDDWPLEG